MSLFENEEYRWRETYFVLFSEKHRPQADKVVTALEELGTRYEISEVRKDSKGRFESLTLISPLDFAAMDISYIAGEEVTAQVAEFNQQIKTMTLTAEEMKKAGRLPGCNARFDIYHFEHVLETSDNGEEDEYLDPGALLVVLECLAKLTHGVSVDPASGAIM